jgi:hypothetical protein
MKTVTIAFAIILIFGALAFASAPPVTGERHNIPRAAASPCPSATPEPFWVDPVTSPTTLFLQVVTVHIGNGERVTVSAESGIFTATGDFDAYGHPASVPVQIAPCTTHLAAAARVRRIEQGGCVYGDYTLYTTRDKFNNPLRIEREPCVRVYLPLALKQ